MIRKIVVGNFSAEAEKFLCKTVRGDREMKLRK
jgi:hypothetical protein